MSRTLEGLRSKFPQYNEVGDDELITAIGQKFPTYLNSDEEFRAEFEGAQTRGEEIARRENKKKEILAEGRDPYQEPEDSWAKAGYSFLAGAGPAVGAPLTGAADIVNRVPGVQSVVPLTSVPGAPNLLENPGVPSALKATAKILDYLGRPFLEGGMAAEEVAEATPGNEAAAFTANALGSAAGSAPYAMLPGGSVVSAGAAGLQSYEQTRLQVKEHLIKQGVDEQTADDMSFKIGLRAGAITGATTGFFNKFGKQIFGGKGGKGVERGLPKFTGHIAEKLRRGAGKKIAIETIREIGGEATEETVDQVLQAALVDWETNPEGMTLK